MTDQTNPAPPRRRGRPCKEPPWLKEVAQMVGRGTPLRRALWSRNVMFTERELKNTYRLKKFREYYETAKIEFYRQSGEVPRRSHTNPGERYLAARLNASQLAEWLRQGRNDFPLRFSQFRSRRRADRLFGSENSGNLGSGFFARPQPYDFEQ